MRTGRSRRSKIAEINVVPYIDVMLVLLVIFMITAPLLNQGVAVDLPKAQAKAIQSQEQEPLIVSVDAKGQYYLNIAVHPDQQLSAQQLLTEAAAAIQLAKQQNKPRQVLVKGDSGVNYGKVIAAMALLQQAGAEKVGLLTEPPSNIA